MSRARAADAWVSIAVLVPSASRPGDHVEEPLRRHQQSTEHHRRQRRDPRLELQLLKPLVQPRLQVVGALSGLARIEPGAGLAGLFLGLELLGPVIPVGDLLGEAVLHGGFGLRDQRQPGVPHFGQMLRDHVCNGVALRLVLHVAVDPGALRPVEYRRHIGTVSAEGPIVEIGRIVHVPGSRRQHRAPRRACVWRRHGAPPSASGSHPGWRAPGRRARGGRTPSSRSSISTAPRFRRSRCRSSVRSITASSNGCPGHTNAARGWPCGATSDFSNAMRS